MPPREAIRQFTTMCHRGGAEAAAACLIILTVVGGCTPDVARDPVPEAMQFDPEAMPPRVPQPTGLVINPRSGRIDFSLAGAPVPADCAAPGTWSPAECEFNQYLETLDGFPTVTPASAPATAVLAAATLTAGTNVVVAAASGASVDVDVGFDAPSRLLTVRPRPSWSVGQLYWIGVRGYQNGVRAADGGRVVGSPTQFLLKQETPLPCGARTVDELDPECPAFALLAQTRSPADAAASLFQLEAIRLSYLAGGGWDLMAAAGLPKSEVAVLWGFPIHTSSVAELDPSAGLVPTVTANEIRVAVQGTIDPTTVSPFVFAVQFGSVIFVDLTALAADNTIGGFPAVAASAVGGEIVIRTQAPLTVGHQYGIFMTRDIHDAGGAPLVPSPISVLLRIRAPLVDKGHSTISSVADADAAMLEAGRAQLATLFDSASFASLTRVTREQLIYCFAFPFGSAP